MTYWVDDMTYWVIALISALVGGVSVLMRSALQYKVAIWSTKADERGKRHAIELLKVLQKDWPTSLDRARAAATCKVLQPEDAPSDTDGDDHA
jgi:hypothetical protein